MVIECVGDAVKVWVNGELVNHGTELHGHEGTDRAAGGRFGSRVPQAGADADRPIERLAAGREH